MNICITVSDETEAPVQSKMLVLVKLTLQILLFVVFLYMYGLPALERLNKKSTIVIKTRKNTDGIEAPSFTISARRNTTGMG